MYEVETLKEISKINNNLSKIDDNLSKLNDSLEISNVIKLKDLYQLNDINSLIAQMQKIKEEIKAIKTNNEEITNIKNNMESTSSKVANELKGFK